MPGQTRARKTWSREETLGFLKCYSARKEEFMHARKKLFAFSHVLDDMISQGITDSFTTTSMLENRLRTLLSAYKSAKDNESQTGASPCPPPYMEEMDEIFGERAHICSADSRELGFRPINIIQPSSSTNMNTPQTSLDEPPVKKRKSYKEEYYKQKLEIKRKYLQKNKKIGRIFWRK